MDGYFDRTTGVWRQWNGRFFEPPDRRYKEELRTRDLADRHKRLAKNLIILLGQATNPSPSIVLPAVRALRAAIDRLERNAVLLARACDWSWATIASELGMSRSAAQKRFAKSSVPARQRRSTQRGLLGPSGTT